MKTTVTYIFIKICFCWHLRKPFNLYCLCGTRWPKLDGQRIESLRQYNSAFTMMNKNWMILINYRLVKRFSPQVIQCCTIFMHVLDFCLVLFVCFFCLVLFVCFFLFGFVLFCLFWFLLFFDIFLTNSKSIGQTVCQLAWQSTTISKSLRALGRNNYTLSLLLILWTPF